MIILTYLFRKNKQKQHHGVLIAAVSMKHISIFRNKGNVYFKKKSTTEVEVTQVHSLLEFLFFNTHTHILYMDTTGLCTKQWSYV